MKDENPAVASRDLAEMFPSPLADNCTADQVIYAGLNGQEPVSAGLELSAWLAARRPARAATAGRVRLFRDAVRRCGCTRAQRRELAEFGRRLDLADARIERLLNRWC